MDRVTAASSVCQPSLHALHTYATAAAAAGRNRAAQQLNTLSESKNTNENCSVCAPTFDSVVSGLVTLLCGFTLNQHKGYFNTIWFFSISIPCLTFSHPPLFVHVTDQWYCLCVCQLVLLLLAVTFLWGGGFSLYQSQRVIGGAQRVYQLVPFDKKDLGFTWRAGPLLSHTFNWPPIGLFTPTIVC